MFEVMIALVSFTAGGLLFGTIGKNNAENIRTSLTDYYEGVLESGQEAFDNLQDELNDLKAKATKKKTTKAKPAA